MIIIIITIIIVIIIVVVSAIAVSILLFSYYYYDNRLNYNCHCYFTLILYQFIRRLEQSQITNIQFFVQNCFQKENSFLILFLFQYIS